MNNHSAQPSPRSVDQHQPCSASFLFGLLLGFVALITMRKYLGVRSERLSKRESVDPVDRTSPELNGVLGRRIPVTSGAGEGSVSEMEELRLYALKAARRNVQRHCHLKRSPFMRFMNKVKKWALLGQKHSAGDNNSAHKHAANGDHQTKTEGRLAVSVPFINEADESLKDRVGRHKSTKRILAGDSVGCPNDMDEGQRTQRTADTRDNL